MTLKSSLMFSAAVLATATFASAQNVINITGATAFRAAAHSSIYALLGGNGVTTFAYTGSSGINGSNRSIFRGLLNGQDTIVRCSWSGSTQGILDLADQTSIQFLGDTENTLSGGTFAAGGTNLGQGANPAPVFENAIARFAFSDVDKALSTRPNASLGGGPVGVVPFMFVAGFSSPSTLNNMTDQQHEALWVLGQAPLSLFTGNAADAGTYVLSTGRNNGSGTRASVLSETGYGAFSDVQQWKAPGTDGQPGTGGITGTNGAGTVAKLDLVGNGGYSSNSFVRQLLTRDTVNANGGAGVILDGGDPFPVLLCSYLTISDAVAATGYQQATGTISGGEGAKPMTYNGVRYSEENVKNGSYTLWGYQQLYKAADANAAENTFDTALRNTVPANMGSAGIPIPDMAVTRGGGDGGLITPN